MGPAAALVAAAAAIAPPGSPAAERPMRPAVPYEESVEVVRRMVAVRLEPRRLASPGDCDALGPGDLVAQVGGLPARVADVERMPRPDVVWLLLDTSGSVEVVRDTVKRDAGRVLRELAEPEGASVALVTIDEDTRLVVAPTDDYDRVEAAIAAVPPGGQSFLRDGLAEVLGQIAGDRREHLVIFWTDGADGLSVGPPAEVEEALGRAPNARIVPIVFPALDGAAGARLLNGLFFGLARRSGGDVFQTGGDWLEKLRASIARRWLVTIVPPAAAPPGAPVRLETPERRCEARVLELAADAGSLAQTPPSWELAWRRQRRSADVEPCQPADDDERPWHRAPHGVAGLIDGCALDIVRERGILYRDRTWGRSEVFSRLELASRPWSIEVPAVGDLARSPEEALDRLAQEQGDRSGRIVHGRTLLALQRVIARAFWETQPGLRELAERTLETEARRGISLGAAAIRVASPAIGREAAEAAARASLEGRRLIEASVRPGDGDLRRTLAAWLGDVGARDLFERWERLLAEQRLEGRLDTADAERRWSALRARFAVPDRARTLALLVPGREGGAGPVGFWRVILPRAVWILGRLTDDCDEFPYDHVPERPMALRALDRALRADPSLARRSLRVAAVEYEPLVKAWKEDPAHPFGRGIVRVRLVQDGAPDAPGTVIEAAFESPRGELPDIVRVDVR